MTRAAAAAADGDDDDRPMYWHESDEFTNRGSYGILRRSLASSSCLRAPSFQISSWTNRSLNPGRGCRSPGWKSSWRSLGTTSCNGQYKHTALSALCCLKI